MTDADLGQTVDRVISPAIRRCRESIDILLPDRQFVRARRYELRSDSETDGFGYTPGMNPLATYPIPKGAFPLDDHNAKSSSGERTSERRTSDPTPDNHNIRMSGHVLELPRSSSIARTDAIWSGLVPQHPPTIRAPRATHSATALAYAVPSTD